MLCCMNAVSGLSSAECTSQYPLVLKQIRLLHRDPRCRYSRLELEHNKRILLLLSGFHMWILDNVRRIRLGKCPDLPFFLPVASTVGSPHEMCFSDS